MNPASVYEVTTPNNQRIKSNTAMVQSIVVSFPDAVYVSNQLHRSLRPQLRRLYPVKTLAKTQSSFTSGGFHHGRGAFVQ